MTGPWTKDREALLTRLWREGQPSSFIGRRLGITPAAVCSKAERLGLAPRRPAQNEHRQELARPAQKPTLAGSGWSWKDVETLKAMAERGHSASQIADEIGNVTRNAVIGKAQRIGVQLKGKPPKPPKRKLRPPAAAPAPPPPALEPIRPQPMAPRALPLVASDPTEPITIEELTHASCRWPIDPDGEHGWRYCGKPRHPRSQLSCYCKEHFLRSVGKMPRGRRAA